ncbi:hypothetical protein ACFY9Q_02415 [Streptomyces sp. NPDC012389]|uniref:hypothetical protein n=1 Tax=Streptomyces sp. NPDC012389 TaxID=3364830 RepID=UPI0036E86DDF
MSEPHVGWTMEQRAAVKRYVQIAAVFAVLGVAFSVFLIISGNSGGWGLLAIIACISMVGYFFHPEGEGRTGLIATGVDGVADSPFRMSLQALQR